MVQSLAVGGGEGEGMEEEEEGEGEEKEEGGEGEGEKGEGEGEEEKGEGEGMEEEEKGEGRWRKRRRRRRRKRKGRGRGREGEEEGEGEGDSHTDIDAGTDDWYMFAPTAWGGHLHSMGTCYRPTRTSESIHEGGERASEHLKERISHGKLLRSTECGMLQNVRDTSAVQGYGTEPNTGWEGGMESGRIKHCKLL